MSRPVTIPAVTTVMKALSDPVRWKIVMMMAATDELACTTLEQTLPVTKSTISYHIKSLVHAHLIDVRKEGRFYFYTLRRDILGSVLTAVSSDLAVDFQGLEQREIAPTSSLTCAMDGDKDRGRALSRRWLLQGAAAVGPKDPEQRQLAHLRRPVSSPE